MESLHDKIEGIRPAQPHRCMWVKVKGIKEKNIASQSPV